MPSQSMKPVPAARLVPALVLACAAALLLVPLAGADAAVRRPATLTLRAPDTAHLGDRVVLSGVLRPRARHRVVRVQKRTATGWRTVKRVRTTRHSHYRAAVVAHRAGKVEYRSRVAGTRRTRPAVSATERIRVERTTTSAPASWAPCGEPLVKADGTSWECTFDDEFDASTGDPTALDRTRWTPQVSTDQPFYTGDPATGVACYVDEPDTVSVSDGALHLSLLKTDEPTPCGSFDTAYKAGMVHTYGKFQQAYGRFEVRAKLPDSSAPGLQETLWLYPAQQTYGRWPGSGEIDFAEFYSQYPKLVVPYLHYLYDPSTTDLDTTDPATGTNVVTSHRCVIDPTVYNTYTLEWAPGVMTLRYNGRTCLVDRYQASNSTDPAAPFNQPFYLLLTQGVGFGSNAPTAETRLPATLDIDYVRAWK